MDLYWEGVGTAAEKSGRKNIDDNQPSVRDDDDGEPTKQEEQLTIATKPKVGSQKKEKKKKIKSTKKKAKDKRKLEALSTVGWKKKKKQTTPKLTPQLNQLALLQQQNKKLLETVELLKAKMETNANTSSEDAIVTIKNTRTMLTCYTSW